MVFVVDDDDGDETNFVRCYRWCSCCYYCVAVFWLLMIMVMILNF